MGVRKVTIHGAPELYKAIKRIGTLPQKCVTQAAKKGARIWLRAVKSNAPVDTGALKSGIILRGERSTKKGKKVYDVMFDPAMNDVFAKTHVASANSSAVRNRRAKVGDAVRAYYPASQEYGYFARNGRYIPGFHFMYNAATDNAPETRQVIIDELVKNVDKEWAKQNG